MSIICRIGTGQHDLRSGTPSVYFAPKREKSNVDAKKFKCPASVGLSLASVLMVFFCLYKHVCPLEIDAYMALIDLINCFVCASRGTVTPKTLRQRAEIFLRKFAAAFGTKIMAPKFHWLLHFWVQYRTFKRLVACWVHERKHRMVKRYCDKQTNTITFEMSVLSEVLCMELFWAP